MIDNNQHLGVANNRLRTITYTSPIEQFNIGKVQTHPQYLGQTTADDIHLHKCYAVCFFNYKPNCLLQIIYK